MKYDWEYVSKEFQTCKNKIMQKSEFQNHISFLFSYGWKWKDSFVIGLRIDRLTNNTLLPDFVLQKDGIPHVVVEIQAPNHVQTQADCKLLFAWMRQLGVPVGLYIGEHIQIFYDYPLAGENPTEVFCLDYQSHDKDADVFVSLFKYGSFDSIRLSNYCLRKIRERLGIGQMEAVLQRLLSAEGVALCRHALLRQILACGYSSTEADALLSQVEITLRQKGTSSPEINAEPSPMVRTIERQNYSRWGIYSVNEREGLCKNQVALELVKVYLRAHPEATYYEIDRVFNSAIPDYVLTKDNRDCKIRHSSDSRIATRWHDETLMSADGIAFCVTTQIGNGCRNDFQRIVKLSEELGYPIKIIE